MAKKKSTPEEPSLRLTQQKQEKKKEIRRLRDNHEQAMQKKFNQMDEQIARNSFEGDEKNAQVFVETKTLDEDIAKRMKKRAKYAAKKEKNITWRMWSDTLISFFRSDKGIIPRDIGDRIYIGNNLYVTKNGMTAIIQINEFSASTPIAFASAAIRAIKTRTPECFIDVEYISLPFEVDFTDPGLKQRRENWERTLNNKDAPDKQKERAARLLYSYEKLKTGIRSFKVTAFIFVRGKNNAVVKRGVKTAIGFLREHDIDCKQLKSNLYMMMPYLLASSNLRPQSVKDVPHNIMTSYTLAQSLPVTQGINSDRGVFMGIDNRNGGPFYIDFRSSSKAKNIYVIGLSGSGKTFMVINWTLNAIADGYGACIMDLKGNEFTHFTLACGGKVLSMRPGSTCFINTFKWNKDDVENDDITPGAYARERITLSKKVLATIVDIQDIYRQEVDGFLDEFLHSVYIQVGAEPNNINTWRRTDILTPFKLYDFFQNYLSNDVLKVYGNVIKQIQMGFSTYLSSYGSGSDIFRNEYDISECLDAPVICFDYGMLNSKRVDDPIPFKLRAIFMSLINDAFVRFRKSLGLWTFKILEESQLADNYLTTMYKEELSLRRSQNQVTALLGNSVTSLQKSPDSMAIFENITMFAIGKVNATARNILIKEFGLEEYEEVLKKIAEDPDKEFRFLFLDRTSKSTAPELSVEVPTSVARGKIFRVVDTEERSD